MSYMGSFLVSRGRRTKENSRVSDYRVPIYLVAMFHMVELRSESLAHC
jgi:hypothetical protein